MMKNGLALFEREKERILKILKDKALMIEHIGSTSVSGLMAKPIIDILLVVEDAAKKKIIWMIYVGMVIF